MQFYHIKKFLTLFFSNVIIKKRYFNTIIIKGDINPMKERILNYMNYIDELLEANDTHTDYEKLISEHLIQIGFFMHERLIHLIVTVVFAILTLMTAFTYLKYQTIGLLALTSLFIILLVPYINHYYLLENGVQKMYKQYDEMLKRKNSDD